MRYLLFLLALNFCFCRQKPTENQLVVVFPQTVLRDAPGEKSAEFKTLKAGETLRDLRQVSHFESEIRMRDARVQAPWLRVQTANGDMGWVFAAWVEPSQPQEDWLLQKKMVCYFGEALVSRRNEYVSGLGTLVSEMEVAAQYREAAALRDTFIMLLVRRSEPNGAFRQPDFSWLPEALPGFVFQQVAEGTQPYLFFDYRFWHPKALASNGLQDDYFVDLCLTAFSADSIESFFPAWTFQLSDYEAASQLGTGRHLKMLQAIDQSWETGALFKPELTAFKEALLEDVLGKNVVYWQPKELIMKELSQILNSDFACMDGRDRMALQARLTMFDDPEANSVRVNLRSGD